MDRANFFSTCFFCSRTQKGIKLKSTRFVLFEFDIDISHTGKRDDKRLFCFIPFFTKLQRDAAEMGLRQTSYQCSGSEAYDREYIFLPQATLFSLHKTFWQEKTCYQALHCSYRCKYRYIKYLLLVLQQCHCY